MSAGNLTGGNQKPICTICFEELRPIVEDLQSIPVCGHVFHELCIQQWMECCPSGKKPTCPVCKQSCLRSAVMRLFFQSIGDQTQVLEGAAGEEVDAEELEKEVMRLGGKVAVLTAAFTCKKT
ncbi:E3 ubiquitin-protein ligase RNF185-like [Asparagus officinalis]|uniref:E3 ubiquitin-protein ligase RNF185-like n=1 Tax=Asparagus officinalis TaxID=4686 RepID=UPI00098E7352|nr:E3 ubiquitin-protein ligase RNF185-like [Asparagus officinalis]